MAIDANPKALVSGTLYTPDEVATYLKVNVKTLEVWRATGRYPNLKFKKVGASVRYRGEDVLAFVDGDHVPAAPYVPKRSRPKPMPKEKSRRARSAR